VTRPTISDRQVALNRLLIACLQKILLNCASKGVLNIQKLNSCTEQGFLPATGIPLQLTPHYLTYNSEGGTSAWNKQLHSELFILGNWVIGLDGDSFGTQVTGLSSYSDKVGLLATYEKRD
jgi:hypothetical protein